jgi:hypothetical protein
MRDATESNSVVLSRRNGSPPLTPPPTHHRPHPRPHTPPLPALRHFQISD